MIFALFFYTSWNMFSMHMNINMKWIKFHYGSDHESFSMIIIPLPQHLQTELTFPTSPPFTPTLFWLLTDRNTKGNSLQASAMCLYKICMKIESNFTGQSGAKSSSGCLCPFINYEREPLLYGHCGGRGHLTFCIVHILHNTTQHNYCTSKGNETEPK